MKSCSASMMHPELLRRKGLELIEPVARESQKETLMQRSVHSLNMLFAQLGQASDEASIAHFIDRHHLLANDVLLHEAAFWTPSQATFLREAILDDADWAQIADELNANLRARH